MEKNGKRKTYTLIGYGGRRVKVKKKIYKAYYKHSERERYLDELSDEMVSIDYFEEIACPLGKYTQSVEDEYFEKEETQKLRQAIQRLKPKYRKLITLHYYEKMSQNSIAKKQKKHQKTISRDVKKALVMLEKAMHE